MMKRHLLWLSIIFLFAGCSGEEGEIAMGLIERDRIILSAPVSEQIRTIAVEEGQTVKSGDLLIQLDPRHAQLLIDQRQALLVQAQAKLNQLQTGARLEQLAAANAAMLAVQAQAQDAERSYVRMKDLWLKKLVAKSEYDSAKALKDQTTAQLSQAKQQWLELKNGTRSEEIAQAQAQTNAAQASLADARQSLADLSILAPKSGVVDVLPWKLGDRVAANVQLITLLASDRLYARVYLPATALGKINQGDSVQVWIDGHKQPVTGTVHNIRSTPAFTPYFALNERDRARLMYLTEIDLPADENLATGIGVEVRLP
ncbi:HlyD family secretion protein [Shewanella polaris]|uniref:HlyD family efflux transporter periplasmic adaptor subunit n=1 Tax=Shewanella polaris TaxID=2588449 RepID=A0A4Y5YEB9_9GAMM|nr:HlyD family efflux transporter periplasmic adaptor subunit [Shewanella polaris]QDE31102.1 HlyD family efflux transporter periplasmic adaptor subunit [Shewanella polaris]